MYIMERYMKALKGYVQNMAQPKSNMAIGYAIEEALRFCAKYIQQVKSTRRVWDDLEKPTKHNEMFKGNGCPYRLSVDLKSKALCTFVLHNAIIRPHGASGMNALIAKSLI
jgi:hypothetical protein